MSNPAVSIDTQRLALVPLSPDHADLLFSMLSDTNHTRYLSLPTATSSEAARQMTEGMLSHSGNCLWLIREKRQGTFVGMCGFLSDSAVPNFVYSIAEDQKGKGYASEAATAAIEVGRRILGTNCVELNIHSENANSLRIAEKLGFTKVGEYKQCYPQQTEPATVCAFRKSYFPSGDASSTMRHEFD